MSRGRVILETSIQDGKECQDFDSGSFVQGGGHSQMAKAPPCTNDSGPKGWHSLPSSIGVSKIKLNSAEDTAAFGATFASQLKAGQILALKGDLGAGKTTFVQGLLNGLSISDTAQSPTFTYLQIYQGTTPIYHFDLYRLKSEQDFVFLGFEEFLGGDGIAVVEWPERIGSVLPTNAHLIELSYCDSGRVAQVHSWGSREV